eukprot:TRINITY_DN6859_c0_g1_i1.p1 TRINITY_DN6859_c0_g1~~TRINITY_DN6859_c0_g1_i1.p1  ORF type:complete len:129 (+),score=3.99 TRINITY_DN6859_c0_g1_i1:32-418(+)
MYIVSEVCLDTVRAAVFHLKDRQWERQGNAYCQVGIYHAPSLDMYRVVAWAHDGSFINSRILPQQAIHCYNGYFYTWADSRIHYGIMIPNEDIGAAFEAAFNQVLNTLRAAPQRRRPRTRAHLLPEAE